jgi:hypothetical protein
MFFNLITFSIIFVTLLWYRIRIGKLTGLVEELKIKVTE